LIAGATVCEPDVGASPVQVRDAVSPGEPRVRVAVCTAGEIWGGVERFVVSLAVGLRDGGCTPLLLLFHEGLLAERLRSAGFSPVVVPGAGKYDIRQVARIREALRSHRTDVLHVHGYRATILGGLARLGTSTQLVRTEHGLLEPLDGWQRLADHARLAVNQLIERVVARATVDATVFVSKDIAAARGARRGARPDRIITNGLDIDGLDAGTPRPARSGFHVGIVGRITKVKGHECLLDALRHLQHLPDLHLHVFGTGPLQERCEALARQNGLRGRVTFHGFCVDMAAEMCALDVLAIPSLHEGLPYTLLEALYLRVPVVASAVGGLKEVIEHGRHGLLVAPQDPRRLADGLECLYRDAALRHRLGEAGHALVRDEYLAPRMVREYVTLYREVAAG
jgi:glycosyltransferase involved in cell wall biosynthesis